MAESAQLRCLIVDDEPLAHRVLQRYIESVDYLVLADQCYDGVSALSRLSQGDIDVTFLDIQMPDLTGLELLDALRQNAPLVVLTTAYTEYAVDSFGYDQVVDYLTKPVKLARFLQTAERLRKRAQSTAPSEARTHLKLQDEHTTHRVALTDIKYAESYGNYVKVYTAERMLLGRRTLKSIEEELEAFGFVRTHKRYIVNADYVSAMEGSSLLVADTWVAVGKGYFNEVKQRFG